MINKTFDDEIRLAQITTPANPIALYNKLYPTADDKLVFLQSNGIEQKIMQSAY